MATPLNHLDLFDAAALIRGITETADGRTFHPSARERLVLADALELEARKQSSPERIELREDGHEDAWVCVCGNRPESQGFFPYSIEVAMQVEPTPAGWDGTHYQCDACKRVIDMHTGVVVRTLPPRGSFAGKRYDGTALAASAYKSSDKS